MGTSKTHHICNCLGRSFTFEEWAAYNREHSHDEVVFRFGDFGFNVADVCLTPHRPVDWRGKACRYSIETAQSPCRAWDYGCSYDIRDSGGCKGAWFIKDPSEGYATEKEAVFACLKRMREMTVREREQDADIRAAIKQLDLLLERYDPAQMELFD